MNKSKIVIYAYALTLTILLLAAAIPALASPGMTDKEGCHVCRTNCAKYGLEAGERHCHGAKVTTKTAIVSNEVIAPAPPVKEVDDKEGRELYFVIAGSLLLAAIYVLYQRLSIKKPR